MGQSRAFITEGWKVQETNEGCLNELSFAVKDVFAIKGHTASAGNPDWLATHDPATNYATAIKRLLKKGATLVGTTVTDELMFSLNGENVHYGTPENPNAVGRIPGGSSSGSAAAVAAGGVDFAIGTDTAGSIRIPASYCGVYGFRPTHGAVSTEGVIPLAARFDTVGWMARSASILKKVGEAFFEKDQTKARFKTIYVPEDALALVSEEVAARFKRELQAVSGSLNIEYMKLSEDGLATFMHTFRVLQGYQIWQTHKDWILDVQPTFAPDIAARFNWTSTIPSEGQKEAVRQKKVLRKQVEMLLGKHGILAFPTSPNVAPLLNTRPEKLEIHRTNTFKLTAISGLSEMPQATMPLLEVEGFPVGFSLLAGRNMDAQLLSYINELETAGVTK